MTLSFENLACDWSKKKIEKTVELGFGHPRGKPLLHAIQLGKGITDTYNLKKVYSVPVLRLVFVIVVHLLATRGKVQNLINMPG